MLKKLRTGAKFPVRTFYVFFIQKIPQICYNGFIPEK